MGSHQHTTNKAPPVGPIPAAAGDAGPALPHERIGVQILTFHTPVDRPPVLYHIRDDGTRVAEEQVWVGHVEAPADKKRTLEKYGIDCRWAWYDPEAHRWERCLFSDQVVAMLRELRTEGMFPYAFDARKSRAQAAWEAKQARGGETRPAVPFWHYLVPAPAALT